MVVLAALWTGVASADSRVSLDPRIALAVERDNLMPLVDPEPSVVVQPRPRIDMVAMAEHRHDRLWQTIDVATLAMSTAALACDWGQTHSAAAEGWRDRHEGNPVMGLTPTTARVNAYFAGVAAINIGLWLVMPKRYKSIVPVALAAAEVMQVRSNLNSIGLCGAR